MAVTEKPERMIMSRRSLIGALAGSIAALMAFALLHYALIGRAAVMRGEVPATDHRLLLASIGLGALAGGGIGGRFGSVRINSVAAGAIRGVMWGVAATVVMGLTSSSFYRPKLAEAHKVAWLAYGVPTGALIGASIGALIGAIFDRRMSRQSADITRVGKTSIDGHPLP